MAHVADGQGDRVENKPGVAWVPARPKLVTGRGWPQPGAAWGTIGCCKRPPESQLAEV